MEAPVSHEMNIEEPGKHWTTMFASSGQKVVGDYRPANWGCFYRRW
jgi:hypothetical protein